jgi:hypothetical protein
VLCLCVTLFAGIDLPAKDRLLNKEEFPHENESLVMINVKERIQLCLY